MVKERQVACDAATAFHRFTFDIHRCWRAHLHSLEHAEGTVDAWEPGARVAFSWHVGRGAETAQAIVAAFEPCAQGTRVRLVHSDWERLGARAASARAEYDVGRDDVSGVRYGCFADGGAPT